mmetsp:Transcript_8738/g.38952  ORF Transcript_8738/g.38952 Transcript_8738/m.38952 type:complete len:81 (+) Transcript_8738:87-329(+)
MLDSVAGMLSSVNGSIRPKVRARWSTKQERGYPSLAKSNESPVYFSKIGDECPTRFSIPPGRDLLPTNAKQTLQIPPPAP